ncbi:crossover junction endodeoxyribonuclease RuvC [Salinicola sp. CPA57]|uniref:crossover junction endodeoxyribonuclease RuvC n=1 Tax=Salinicola sp. CPA57 TaxID=1949080 RepID=UPI0013005D3B|nr:crossover junction endodeoxyribonuclease RuvC [Salinicola sp. CPA57]
MATILGVDQSFTNTGIVIIDDQKMIHHEVIASDKNQSRLVRAQMIAERVLDIAIVHSVEGVRIEGLSLGSISSSTRDLAGLQFLILDRLTSIALEPLVIAPTSLKKKFTGNGRASKDEMLDAVAADVRAIFNQIPKSRGRYDLADAYALASIIM